MSAPVEIPLVAGPQRFSVRLNDVIYQMRITWNDADMGGYFFDLGAEDGTPLIAGHPLVTGANLLGQYGYLEVGGKLVVTTDRGAGDLPTYDGLGATSHLFFIPDA